MNDANSTDSLEAEIIRLLSVVQKCVAQALLSPPKLTHALVRAFYPRKKPTKFGVRCTARTFPWPAALWSG
mgnify:CR=1 FL=1